MRCCSITKKVVFAAVAVALVVGIYHFGSYIKSSIQHAERNLPPEVRLKMVKEKIAKLDHEIDKNWTPIAQLDYEIKNLKKDTANEQAWLDGKKGEMLAAAGDLEAKVQKVSYNNKTMTPAEARKALAKDTDIYKARSQKFDSMNRVLAAKEKALATYSSRQEEMKNMKGELEARVAQIEADLQVLELAKTKSPLPSGDSTSLDDIKRMLNDLEEDTTVQLKALELREKFHKSTESTPSEPTKDSGANDEVIKRVRAVTGEEGKTESAGD
jgi:chromosome segregation ATPase